MALRVNLIVLENMVESKGNPDIIRYFIVFIDQKDGLDLKTPFFPQFLSVGNFFYKQKFSKILFLAIE